MKFIRFFFIAMVLTGFLYFLAGEFILPSEQLEDSGRCDVYLAEWTWVKSDGTRVPIEIPGQCDAEKNEKVKIETTLPEKIENNTYLCFWSLRQDMELYVDSVLRQEYSTKDTRLFGRTSSAAYVFLELAPEDAGKVLTVITQTDSAYSGIFREIYYGSQTDIWNKTFEKFGIEIIVSFMMLIMGAGSVIVSMILNHFYHKKVDLKYLGWGVFIAAVWVLFNSIFRQLIFKNISVASDITFLAVMLLPMPYLVYMNAVQNGRYQRAYEGTGLVIILNSLICIFLQITNKKDFSETIVWMEAVCFLAILVMGVTIVMDIIRKRVGEYRMIAIGILGACLAAVAQIILYTHKVDTPFSGIMVAIGLLFLLSTAVINTAQELLQMEREKEKAVISSEAKAQFLANMSHEIRTPINAMLGMDEMILRESTEKNITEYAHDIQSAGRSLLSLLNDILDFSKIESGKLEIFPGEYELSSLLNDCYNMVSMRAKDKNLKLCIENNPALPRRLFGDEMRIRQIIMNLLTNGVKYTKEGTVTLSVDGESMGEDRLMLKISVKDTGIGISPENQEKLFSSFQRVDEYRNRHIEGNGLGLAITRQLTELMEGSISVESELGKGSVFLVQLPQTVISGEPMGDFSKEYIKSAVEEKPYQESFQAPEGRILVVDDVAMNLKVIKALLKKTKLRIDTAESGQQCLEMIKKERYHIIFLDHMMPDMDGMEVLERIHQLSETPNKDTPVIMLTANAINGAKEEYLKAGFIDYLSKPIQAEKLERMILKYLPADLIVDSSDVEDAEKTVEKNSIFEKMEFLDTEAGLYYCMNNGELYMEILNKFLHSEIYDYLEILYQNQDWGNYQIQVHALKSTSLTIGAVGLSDEAEKLEFAARKKDIAFIENHHETCMKDYRKLLDQLEEVLGKDDV